MGTKKPFFLEIDLSNLLIVYYFGFQSHDASLLGNKSRIIPFHTVVLLLGHDKWNDECA